MCGKGLQEQAIDNYPYFIFEQNITLINEMAERAESSSEGDGLPNSDMTSAMSKMTSDMSSMMNKFK